MSSSMGFGLYIQIYPIYEMDNKSHVPNDQPVIINHD